MNRATLLLTFKPGARVKYIGFKPEHLGKLGTVRNIVKRREVVVIDFDNYTRYDAFPTSLEIVRD